jgi:mannose/cellobiose epimerase-like protein (N-acyl-D-glucosamine 2-epimerase family)
MQWAAVVLALVKALASLMSFLRERQLLEEWEARAAAEALRKHLDDIEKGKRARAEVRDRNSRVPKSDSLPDDGFRRD